MAVMVRHHPYATHWAMPWAKEAGSQQRGLLNINYTSDPAPGKFFMI